MRSRSYSGSSKLLNPPGTLVSSNLLPNAIRLDTQNCADIVLHFDSWFIHDDDELATKYSTEHYEEHPLGSNQKGFDKPSDLVFETFGTTTFAYGMFLVENGLNARKTFCYQLIYPIEKSKFETLVRNAIALGRDEYNFLQPLRESFGAYAYINEPEVMKMAAYNRISMHEAINHIAEQVIDPQGNRPFLPLVKGFEVIEPEWHRQAADSCNAKLTELINLAYTLYEEANWLPANSKAVKQAIDSFRKNGLPLVQPPRTPSWENLPNDPWD
ncbi:hypothetical protein F5Y18DRAFT_430239 [Xylariaceae sp. FL1019]|nr:hypothetical protein F5Y18DRAFT_430239 [Xylariaceae sp. FL1019]